MRHAPSTCFFFAGLLLRLAGLTDLARATRRTDGPTFHDAFLARQVKNVTNKLAEVNYLVSQVDALDEAARRVGAPPAWAPEERRLVGKLQALARRAYATVGSAAGALAPAEPGARPATTTHPAALAAATAVEPGACRRRVCPLNATCSLSLIAGAQCVCDEGFVSRGDGPDLVCAVPSAFAATAFLLDTPAGDVGVARQVSAAAFRGGRRVAAAYVDGETGRCGVRVARVGDGGLRWGAAQWVGATGRCFEPRVAAVPAGGGAANGAAGGSLVVVFRDAAVAGKLRVTHARLPDTLGNGSVSLRFAADTVVAVGCSHRAAVVPLGAAENKTNNKKGAGGRVLAGIIFSAVNVSGAPFGGAVLVELSPAAPAVQPVASFAAANFAAPAPAVVLGEFQFAAAGVSRLEVAGGVGDTVRPFKSTAGAPTGLRAGEFAVSYRQAAGGELSVVIGNMETDPGLVLLFNTPIRAANGAKGQWSRALASMDDRNLAMIWHAGAEGETIIGMLPTNSTDSAVGLTLAHRTVLPSAGPSGKVGLVPLQDEHLLAVYGGVGTPLRAAVCRPPRAVAVAPAVAPAVAAPMTAPMTCVEKVVTNGGVDTLDAIVPLEGGRVALLTTLTAGPTVSLVIGVMRS